MCACVCVCVCVRARACDWSLRLALPVNHCQCHTRVSLHLAVTVLHCHTHCCCLLQAEAEVQTMKERLKQAETQLKSHDNKKVQSSLPHRSQGKVKKFCTELFATQAAANTATEQSTEVLYRALCHTGSS